MDAGVCSVCGERNPPGTAFCVVCQNYLGWEKTVLGPAVQDGPPRQDQADQAIIETQVFKKVSSSDPPPESTGTRSTQDLNRAPVDREPVNRESANGESDNGEPGREPADLVAEDRFRVSVESSSVTVAPTGEIAELELRISNISIRVDGYRAELAPGAPEWLSVKSTAVELLPGTDDLLRTRFQVVSTRLTPAQLITVPLRIRAMNEPIAYVELPVAVTVSVVEAPLQLRAEPRLLRVQDRADTPFTITLDNSMTNRPIRVELAGTDPELAVRYQFDPPVVQVEPGSIGTAKVVVSAEQPPNGQEVSRLLTVTAREGTRSVETLVTFVQITSVLVEDPPVGLQLEPALLRVRDNPVGLARLTVDNRNGRDWAHLQLSASDPEQAVAVGFDSVQLHVPPGRTAQVQVRFHAAMPELGTEASRTVTVTATDARGRTTSTVGTFVQVTSASPMATLVARLEPEVIRVRDADGATAQLVLDNRKGRFRVRLQLSGSDPERAVGFAFGPPVVDVEAGQTRSVEVRLAAWRPPPGQEWTRPYTVSASDGQASVEASGSMVISSSRSAMETLTLRLDPSVLRLDGRRRGQISGLIDNRNGTQPVQISLSGDDPENAIRFAFSPAVVAVEPGRIVRTTIGINTPRVRPGQEVIRSFTVTASDGHADVQSAGTVTQTAPVRPAIARYVLTTLGVLLMILGARERWFAGVDETGLQLTFNFFANRFRSALDPRFALFDPALSAGVAVIALAVVAALGMIGRRGFVTIAAACTAALVVLGAYVVLVVGQSPPTLLWPITGSLLVLAGCALAFVGGLLARR